MAFLIEDIERINKLPIDEYIKVVGNFTQDEYKDFFSKQPINEGNEPFHAVMVDCTLEEDVKNNDMINADDFLNEMREKYGLNK